MDQTKKAIIIKAIAEAAAIKTLTIDIRNPVKIRVIEKMKAIKAKKAIITKAIKITKRRAIILKGIKCPENLFSRP